MSLIKKIHKFKNGLKRFYYIDIKNDEFMKQIYKWKDIDGDKSLRLNYPLTKDSVVIDAGGYVGDFAAEISELYDPYIFIFEPIHEFYEKIKSRFKNNPKVTPVCAGLSDQTGVASIAINDTASSIYADEVSRERQEVKLLSFLDFIQKYKISKIDLMKINIEGGEYSLLTSMVEHKQIDLVNYYQIQFHNFIGQAIEKRNMIRNELEKTHRCQWNYPFVWESWERIK